MAIWIDSEGHRRQRGSKRPKSVNPAQALARIRLRGGGSSHAQAGLVGLLCVIAQRQLEGVDLASRRQLSLRVSPLLPRRKTYRYAGSRFIIFARALACALAHVVRAPFVGYFASPPTPQQSSPTIPPTLYLFRRGGGRRREAARPLVTGTLVHPPSIAYAGLRFADQVGALLQWPAFDGASLPKHGGACSSSPH